MDRPITILGGGVLGLTIGCRLIDAGRDVTIVDPAPLAKNASGVAAGMLAPASEALAQPEHFARLRRARDLWPELAAKIGAGIDFTGAVHLGSAIRMARLLSELQSLGAHAAPCESPTWVEAPLDGVLTPDDWRLDAVGTLGRLQAAFLAQGGRWIGQEEAAVPAESEVVVAAGFGSRDLAALAPELDRLTPVKGQIIRLGGGPVAGSVVRFAGLYFAPDIAGLIVGATMQVGFADTTVDDEALDRLQRSAAELSPQLANVARTGAAGVRAASPDGWPLVGPSQREGIWLAAGALRNGWLLAPLIARVLIARMRREAMDEDAIAFDPARFGRS